MICRVSESNFSIFCLHCTLSGMPFLSILVTLLQGVSSSLKCIYTPSIWNIIWYKTTKHFHTSWNWHPSCSGIWDMFAEASTESLWSAPHTVEDAIFHISSRNSSLAISIRVPHSWLTYVLEASSAWRSLSSNSLFFSFARNRSSRWFKIVLSFSSSCAACIVSLSLASVSCDSRSSANFLDLPLQL